MLAELVCISFCNFIGDSFALAFVFFLPLLSRVERGRELDSAGQVHLHVDVEANVNALLLVDRHVRRDDVPLRRLAIDIKRRLRTEGSASDCYGLTKACAASSYSSSRC